MTTGSLALIVFTVIVIQVVAFALFVFFRRKREMQKEGALEPLAQSVSRPIKQQPVNPPKADLAWTGAREFVVHKKVFENRSHSVCSFYLKPKDGQPLAPFLPGQFLTLNLSLPHLDGSNKMQSVFRCYSISERPRMCCYRITVKRVLPPENHPEYPPGRCSNHLFDQVNEGVSLKVNAPTGQFYLKTEVRLPIVLVGAGIGVTPILSMLSTLLDQGYTQEIWFFYGVQNGEEHIMKAYLLSLQQRYQN
ncbi:MAG: FAD-binding oxidoreductase, partial [Thiomicrorhabdus sp.]|nr:FAD-binding oxidoreductase [Thiomicrorhabdus sp.]